MELVPLPERGRRYTSRRKVHLGDAGPNGLLRLDGVARYLQDVAADDWDDAGFEDESHWVVRRCSIRRAQGGRWPRLGEELALTTWCSGSGAAIAERRTDLLVGDVIMVEAAVLWVLVDPSGRPTRLKERFQALYGEATGGRRVSGRIANDAPPPGLTGRPWPLRQADLDVLGHVNNAALWAAVTELASGTLRSATMVHHAAVEADDEVTLLAGDGRLWLLAQGAVAVSAELVED
jgi:acyl-ACP thioesterase